MAFSSSASERASERADRPASITIETDLNHLGDKGRGGGNQFPNLKLDPAVIKGHGKVSRKEAEGSDGGGRV